MRGILKEIKQSPWEIIRQKGSHLRLENKVTGQRTTFSLQADENGQKNIRKQLGLGRFKQCL